MCEDIDECFISSTCPQNSICKNGIGDYSCECIVGFSYGEKCVGAECQNFECHDDDECEVSNGGCEQVCINTLGSFECNCFEDFRKILKNKTKIYLRKKSRKKSAIL